MKFKVLLLLIALLLSTGFVSATLTVRSIVSTSGPGYRMANDTIAINVSSTSNVSINGIPCTKIDATTYVCVVTDTVDTATATYQITNDLGQSASPSINVDNNIGSVSYTVTNVQGSAMLDYAVQDLGFNNNNLCSGIATLTVYDGTTVLNTVNISGTSGTCMYSGSINLSIGNSGTKSIYLEVTDNAGNKKDTPVQNITLDLSPPDIVNGLTVTRSGTDEELDILGGSASFVVDIYFSIIEENLKSITLDLSGANTNPAVQFVYKHIDVPLSNCQINSSGSDGKKIYNCVYRVVSLKLPGDTLSVNVLATDMYDAASSATLTKSFTIDNIEPKVSMTTDKCDSTGRCYVSNGLNKIILTMNKQNFEKKLLFVSISGSTFRVQNCTDGDCFAMVPLTCDSGSQVAVSIDGSSGLESQDDSGNVVVPYNTYFYCDNTAPIITSINVTGVSSDSIIKDLLVSGSTLTVTANVIEAESLDLFANVQLDKIKNATEKGTCTKISNNNFNCVWTVSSINDGYYDANILVNVTDAVGNEADKSYPVKVFGHKADNETPDAIDISLLNVYPEEINRVVLDMATGNSIPYYIYATYSLNAKSGFNKVSVLHQQLDVSKCVYVGTLGTTNANTVFSEITVNNPYSALYPDIGRVDLKFLDNTDPNILDNEFTISCNISVMVKDGDNIYQNPQELQLDMPFKLVNTKLCNQGQECTPGEVLGKKLETAENGFFVKAKLMGTINMLIPKIQKLCSLRGYIGQATSASQILSMAMQGVSVSTGNFKVANIPISMFMQLSNIDVCLSGASTSNAGGYGFNQNTGLNMNMNQVGGQPDAVGTTQALIQANQAASFAKRTEMAGKCQQFVGKACDFLTCTNTNNATKITTSNFDQYKGDNSVVGKSLGITDTGAANGAGALPDIFGGSKVGGFGQQSMNILTKNINVPDVRNSIVMAAATQCWPAVYYNLNKWRQTECNYVYCLKMASYTGTDISTCDMARKAQVCSIIVGEIFELPGANIIKNLMENAADYATNFLPLASASLLKKAVCPEYTDGTMDPFKSGQMNLPKDLKTQTFKIYGCQLPIQIARLADISTRSSQRAQFIYPETPDMCQYADCVGQENCKYEPTFWDTINKMQLPVKNNSIPVDKNTQIAAANQNIVDTQNFVKATNGRYLLADGKINADTAKNTYGYDSTTYDSKLKSLQDRGIFTDVTLADPTKVKDDIANDQEVLDSVNVLIKDKKKELSSVAPPTTVDVTSIKNDLTDTTTKLTQTTTQLNKLTNAYQPVNIINTIDDKDLPPGLLTSPAYSARIYGLENVQGLSPEAATQQAKVDFVNSYRQAQALSIPDKDIDISKLGVGSQYSTDYTNQIKSLTDQQKQLTQKQIGDNGELIDAGSTNAKVDEYVATQKELTQELTQLENTKSDLEKSKATTAGSEATSITDLSQKIIDLQKCIHNYVQETSATTSFDASKCAVLTSKSYIDPAKLNAMTFNPDDIQYANLNIEQKAQYYQNAITGLNELDALDKKLGVSGENIYNLYVPDSLGLTDAQKKIIAQANSQTLSSSADDKLTLDNKRKQYWQALGLCNDGETTCDDFAKQLSVLSNDDPEYKQLYTDKITAKRNEAKDYITKSSAMIKAYDNSNKMGNALFMGLQFLNAQHMIDFMFTPYWTEKMFGMDVSDLLDFNKYKESLCNPANPINLGSDSDSNTVISCSSGSCQAVLTYAAERIELEYPNKTRYNIYTTVYYISGGDLRGRKVTYNVYFRGPGVNTIQGFRDPSPLNAFDIVQKKKVFQTSGVYDQMCIEFSEKFPPDNSLNNALSYCRPIVISNTIGGTSGGSAFNTGSPWSPEEQNATNSGQYLDGYDSNGNRIQAPGTNPVTNGGDNRPPGLYE